jgi:hypothetical protein
MEKIKPQIEGIESGLDKVQSKFEPDAEDKLENAAVEKTAAETKVLLENTRNTKDIRLLRRLYSEKIYRLATVYIIYLVLLSIIQGFHILGFSLDSPVLVALIGLPLLGYLVKILAGSSK